MNICLAKFLILVKISVTVTEILTFSKWSSKVCSFQKRIRTFHEVDSDVSIIDRSPCPWNCRDTESWCSGFHITFAIAMASKQPWFQPGVLCNLWQAAKARLPHANPWRQPPRWATRGGVVKIWPWDHQCGSYSVGARLRQNACI